MARRCSILLITLSFFSIFAVILLISMLSLPKFDIESDEPTLDSFHNLDDKHEMLNHIEDMQRLKNSINLEISRTEQRQKKLKESVRELEKKREEFEKVLLKDEKKLSRIKVDIENMLVKHSETLQNYPPISLPMRVLPNTDDVKSPPFVSDSCTFSTCFDFSRCSILSRFPVYLYPVVSDSSIVASWKSSLLASNYVTDNPSIACLFIILIETKAQASNLKKLSHWHGDGGNHLVINLADTSLQLNGSRAIIVQSDFKVPPRSGFDVPLPSISSHPIEWPDMPLLLPWKRKYLVTFVGKAPQRTTAIELEFVNAFQSLNSEEFRVFISLDCLPKRNCNSTEWCYCDASEAAGFESTFYLLPNSKFMTSRQFMYRLYEALRSGTIPVILGDYHSLPFEEVVTWDSAVVKLPRQRVTEVVYIVRNILEPDIVQYKLNGRRIFSDHLSSVNSVSETLLVLMRSRTGIPPNPPIPFKSDVVYDENNPMLTFQVDTETREILGPLEDPFPSISYQRNFTSWLDGKKSGQFEMTKVLYPTTPWDPILPTDAKFHGSAYGFRPINHGAGGSGKEFSMAIGGNNHAEQFTIVVLTYDRPDLLQMQLTQFNELPYLNKVLVVWNNPVPPNPTLQWPKLHVPIQVIKSYRNSLNNRFIPYSEIETEAILSMDDDMYLRDFEIIFAFRVWRENRDRIVGFPGRYHAWNKDDEHWNYNSNHSCELSMILTGAAFFHKYYTYQYTYSMPQAIRDKVDEFMNCEDIAMNFLVSHITGKPPIKTTSRWTFRCPTCGEAALWTQESHFQERHQCINFFIKVYGYLPLKYTQFRADSVLFKTRVPQDKTKCFQSV